MLNPFTFLTFQRLSAIALSRFCHGKLTTDSPNLVLKPPDLFVPIRRNFDPRANKFVDPSPLGCLTSNNFANKIVGLIGYLETDGLNSTNLLLDLLTYLLALPSMRT